jgi:hypothetical protein
MPELAWDRLAGLDGRMFVHKGPQDLPDLDLEVSSLHEQAASAFIQQGGFEGMPAHAAGEFPHLRALRVGVHVSMGARQDVRAVGGALGMEHRASTPADRSSRCSGPRLDAVVAERKYSVHPCLRRAVPASTLHYPGAGTDGKDLPVIELRAHRSGRSGHKP